MNKALRGFWIRLALFLLPFAGGFLLFTGTMIYIGESMPLRLVAWLQQRDDNILFGYRYGNRNQQFKSISANLRQPTVMALGSSRILQFRAGFFNRAPAEFYNAAAPAWRLPEVSRLLYSLDEAALPEVLILALDSPWFNANVQGDIFPADVSDFANVFLINRSFIQDVIRGVDFERPGFRLGQYLERIEPGGSGGLALGMRAIRDGHGFRSDGSEQYGDFLVAQWLWQPQQRENHLNWMREGRDMYAYGDTVSERAMAELTALLDYAARHSITVIGFLPSYEPQLWAEMIAGGQHSYITALTPRLQALFDRYDFPFFDFSDGGAFGIQQEEFFDGWHASELGNLRLYLYMLSALPEVLGRFSDEQTLQQIADNATNTWDVFGPINETRVHPDELLSVDPDTPMVE